MHKLLPFRQYDEKDVINLFSLDLTGEASPYTNLKPGDETLNNGFNWSGTAVTVRASDAGEFGGDQPNRTTDGYLGAIGSGDQGYALQSGSFYPSTRAKVGAPALNGTALGITLRPTLAWDENHTKLLDYDIKKDELQCVLPGEAVPVATKGFFTLVVDTGAAASSTVNTCGIIDAVGIGAGGVVPGDELVVGSNGRLTKFAGGSARSLTGATVDAGSSASNEPVSGGTIDLKPYVVAKVVATGVNAGKNVALIQLG